VFLLVNLSEKSVALSAAKAGVPMRQIPVR
jgi:hypothetical protein